jgi:hypothetical protein
MASASASAVTAGWMVNGTMLSGSAALATTARVDEKGVLTGAGFKIICEGKTLSGIAPEISAPNTGMAQSLEFTECAGEEPCTLASTTIKTFPIGVEATLEGALAVVATFKPLTGTVFSTIKFEGTECGLAGETPIKGTVKVLAPTGQDERTLQLITSIATEASKELLVGSGAASLKGSILLQLANHQLWSFL